MNINIFYNRVSNLKLVKAILGDKFKHIVSFIAYAGVKLELDYQSINILLLTTFKNEQVIPPKQLANVHVGEQRPDVLTIFVYVNRRNLFDVLNDISFYLVIGQQIQNGSLKNIKDSEKDRMSISSKTTEIEGRHYFIFTKWFSLTQGDDITRLSF